jgi:hypothetical protein
MANELEFINLMPKQRGPLLFKMNTWVARREAHCEPMHSAIVSVRVLCQHRFERIVILPHASAYIASLLDNMTTLSELGKVFR